MAQDLARWAARVGLGEQLVTTKTLRRRFFALAGRLTRSARRLTLHLPQRAGPGKPSSIAPWPDCEPFPAQQTSQWVSCRLTPSSVRQCHFLHSALLIAPPITTVGRHHRICVAASRRPSSPFYWYQGRTAALPLALIPRLIGRTASPRWIWAYSKTAWLPGRVTLM